MIARTTVQRVTKEDLLLPQVNLCMQEFNGKIKEKMDDSKFRDDSPAQGLTLDDELDLNDEPEGEAKLEQDDYTEESYDAYLGAELLIPSGDHFIVGRVTKRKRDNDGNPIGQRNNIPILDTREYEVQFGDGSTLEYTANLVAENMMAQSDPEGNRHMIFKEIVDHQMGEGAITCEDIHHGHVQQCHEPVGNSPSTKSTRGCSTRPLRKVSFSQSGPTTIRPDLNNFLA